MRTKKYSFYVNNELRYVCYTKQASDSYAKTLSKLNTSFELKITDLIED